MSPAWLDTTIDIANRLNTYGNNIEPPKQTYSTTKVDTTPIPAASNNYMTLERFNEIEYDSSHLWVCKIDGAPAPFSSWFPAQDISEPSKGLSISQMSFGIEEVNTLNGFNAQSLRAEFIDNDRAVLELWIKDWQENVAYNNSSFKFEAFRYLDEILKTLYISKYTWQKELVYTRAYYVLPSGEIQFPHNNDPTLKQLNVTFSVFGSTEIKK